MTSFSAYRPCLVDGIAERNVVNTVDDLSYDTTMCVARRVGYRKPARPERNATHISVLLFDA